ncbi:hypothetical protein [Saccharomonospora sp.]|uniref:hypothetical protein n=1 Tax=Saccharomonospora sp. TaxID=33913 RepID=UPI0026036747|nr:hypothetical protein [Saccharomonospora sp.]
MNHNGGQSGKDRRESTKRRRLLDEVFGEVLPDTTRDERRLGSTNTLPDDWYRENRPPHHDR